MLSEEKKAINLIKQYREEIKDKDIKSIFILDTAINLITKLQKENEKKDKEIKKLKQNIDYQVLCNFLISSVSNEEPVWTEKHIEELLENFEMRWKNAYK